MTFEEASEIPEIFSKNWENDTSLYQPYQTFLKYCKSFYIFGRNAQRLHAALKEAFFDIDACCNSFLPFDYLTMKLAQNKNYGTILSVYGIITYIHSAPSSDLRFLYKAEATYRIFRY